ncbi:MAG: anthranilate synthase component I family protein [Campylobacterales bacterium]
MLQFKRCLYDTLTPIALTEKLTRFFEKERVFLFESGINNENGNFSFVLVGERERLWHQGGKSFYRDEAGQTQEVDENPLNFLKKRFSREDQAAYRRAAQEMGVGFVDGFVGFIGYDMVKVFEPVLKRVMDPLADVTKTPDLDLIRPKYVFAYAHKSRMLTALSTLPDSEGALAAALKAASEPIAQLPLVRAEKLGEGRFDFTKAEFFERIDAAKKEIKNGEIFQILLANRYVQPARIDPFSFYRVLRSKNPSPYQFYLPYETFAIAGSSPEVMVRLESGQILLRPIAGTRKRGSTLARDRELEHEMLSDEKERAEHIMLVDLGRNDVGRVAKAGTVKVKALMHVERFSHVMHIVSDVVAEIAPGKDMFDLFMATFTAGTMTGAPKIKAMELIARFEGAKRGFYSGAIVHFGFSGDMDSAITIRSAQIEPGRAIFHAGAGIVADSQPELEHLEVTNKMAAVMKSYEELLAL